MTDEDRVVICQKEINRLRLVVRNQEDEIQELKKLFWCIIRGLVADDAFNQEMLYSALLMSEGNQYQHELLKQLIAEEIER